MKRSQCYLVLIASIFCSMAYAQERITLGDGSHLSVYIVKPAQTLSEPSPLVILMGGVPGNASISRDTSIWQGGGFAERGWMVAVPVSPNNRAFRGDENNHTTLENETNYFLNPNPPYLQNLPTSSEQPLGAPWDSPCSSTSTENSLVLVLR